MLKFLFSLQFFFIANILASDKPNMIFILADDMGYGDMSHMGGKAKTPFLDQMAKESMWFHDAHTTSSVCTPTRYGILTGRYNWRSRLKKGVLNGFSAPLIPKERVTIANFLKGNGYHTACIGKWHLGIGWGKSDNPWPLDGKKHGVLTTFKRKYPMIDYAKPVISPVHNGFHHFWGISASLDMPPYVYIKDDKVLNLPSTTKAFLHPNRPGPSSAQFDSMNCLKDFAREARRYIKERAQDKSKPFFLYLPLTSPHSPIIPSKKFQGKSPLGAYGDFLMETDWVVGEVMAELKAQGIANNTLLLFTADNGCSPIAKIPDLADKGHKVNAHWRGHKADIYEGGHRVPFIVRWPAKVKAGAKTFSTITTADFFNTAAEIIDKTSELKSNMAEDSFSFLAELTGTGKTKRTTSIHHSINGSFAIRRGKWKLCLCPGSGGWSKPRPNKNTWKQDTIIQLYNLENDQSEQKNLAKEMPEVVKELVDQLAKEIKNGRSTPGEKVNNDGAIPFPKALLEKFPQLKN